MNYEQFEHQIDGGTKSIFLVNMTQELDYNFSQLAQKGIGKYLRQNKRVGIIMNKKGYSNGIICHECGFVPQCKRCSVSIHYHKLPSGDQIGLCHICKTEYVLPRNCAKCGSVNIKPFGIGIQKVAEYLKEEYGAESVIIESATANSKNKINKILTTIKDNKSGNFPVLIGTSLLSTPIPDYPLDLIVMLNADIGLNIPDYNASEKNFNFLYETFTKHQSAQFVVQTFDIEQYSIRSACKLDKTDFYKIDNEYREKYKYPPYADLCVLLYKNEIEERVFTKVDKLYKELLYMKEKYGLEDMEIYSTPPLIYKIFGKYRYNIILKGKNLRNFMDIVFTKLNLVAKGFKVDRKADSIV